MKVFLDMDGVLVDFRRGVCEAFGRDDPSNNWVFWEDWEGVSSKDVDKKCDTGFWVNLNWTHDGLDILKAIFEKFIGDFYLLTTPMPNIESYTGKALWVDKYIPVYNNRTIITRSPKNLLAGPNTLLIDDKDQNIEEFVAAGGRGILVPKPWNELHELSHITLDYVKRCLEEF